MVEIGAPVPLDAPQDDVEVDARGFHLEVVAENLDDEFDEESVENPDDESVDEVNNAVAPLDDTFDSEDEDYYGGRAAASAARLRRAAALRDSDEEEDDPDPQDPTSDEDSVGPDHQSVDQGVNNVGESDYDYCSLSSNENYLDHNLFQDDNFEIETIFFEIAGDESEVSDLYMNIYNKYIINLFYICCIGGR